MNKSIVYIFLCSLISCTSSDNIDSNSGPVSHESSLIGVWETEACEQSTDLRGDLINIWSKGIYHFTESERINFRPQSYLDSGCITLDTSATLEYYEYGDFKDLGKETLQEGISGNRILISIVSPSSGVDVEAFYTINNNVLCFSSTFTFGPNRIVTYGKTRNNIDFARCLIPNQSP